MNSTEYLKLVQDNRETLKHLVDTYHPFYKRVHHHHITAPGPEVVCALARKQIQEKNQEPDLDSQDAVYLSEMFNEVWFGMPESIDSRCEQGFGLLCDLCSELEVEG